MDPKITQPFLHPGQPSPNFRRMAYTLKQELHQFYAHRKKALNILKGIKPADATITDLLPIFHLESERRDFLTRVAMGAGLFPDDIRSDGSEAAIVLKAKLDGEQLDLWKYAKTLIKAVAGKAEAMDREDALYLRDWLKNQAKDHPSGTEEETERLQKKRIELEEKFQKNIDDSDKKFAIWFSRRQLDGLGASFIETLNQRQVIGQSELTYAVTLERDRADHVMLWAEDEETRKRVYIASHTKSAWRGNNESDEAENDELVSRENPTIGNESVLYAIANLYVKIAKLRNIDHAQFVLEDLAMNTPENVVRFFTSLRDQLLPAGQKEKRALLDRKEEYLRSSSSPNASFDGEFNPWDFLFYDRLIREDKCSAVAKMNERVDDKTIAGFCPLKHTIRGLLNIFEKLFGLMSIEITGHKEVLLVGKASDLVWHSDVQAYSLWSTNHDPKYESEFLGYMYFDLLPRAGKRSAQARYLQLKVGFSKISGIRSYPRGVLISTLEISESEEHMLLSHQQVIGIFHEIGHGIHDTVSKTKYSIHHGANAPVDFEEVPSQMLENWCWIPEELQAISLDHTKIPEYEIKLAAARANYEKNIERNPKLPFRYPAPDVEWQMPIAMARRLAETRHVNIALRALKTVSYSEFALILHGYGRGINEDKINIEDRWIGLLRDTRLFDVPEEGGRFEAWGPEYASIPMFKSGASVAYYKYAYGLAMAYALFSKFAENPGDSKIIVRNEQAAAEQFRPEISACANLAVQALYEKSLQKTNRPVQRLRPA